MQLKRFIKLAVSICMLALVVSIIDLGAFTETLLSVPLTVFVIVVVGYVLGQVLSAYKWWCIARAAGIDVPYSIALKSYFIGMFVNCFGLGIVGGDVARGVLLSDGRGVKAAGVATVVADRLQGLAVLALIGALAAAFFASSSIDPSLVYLLCVIGFGIVLGWIVGPALLVRLVPSDHPLQHKAREISDAFPKDWSTIAYITLLSAAFHLLQISLHWVMGYGLGVSIAWTVLLVTIPFVNILSSLPISWNGIGIRENAYIFFLAPAVLTSEQAVALGAMWLIAITVSSAIGGVIAVVTRDFSVFSRKEAASLA